MPGDEAPADGPRITCVISALAVGGAERVLTALADRWAALGWTVTILTFAGHAETAFYRPDPRVIVRPLDLFGASRTPLGMAANRAALSPRASKRSMRLQDTSDRSIDT